jgi:hypothetical protein
MSQYRKAGGGISTAPRPQNLDRLHMSLDCIGKAENALRGAIRAAAGREAVWGCESSIPVQSRSSDAEISAEIFGLLMS